MSAGLAQRVIQRSVHRRASRQYQRMSAQAPPPSATIWSAGKRIPHIQQGCTTVDSLARAGVRRSSPAMISSPPGSESGRDSGKGLKTGSDSPASRLAQQPSRQSGTPTISSPCQPAHRADNEAVTSHGAVREWDDDRGFGVDSPDTPGGCSLLPRPHRSPGQPGHPDRLPIR